MAGPKKQKVNKLEYDFNESQVPQTGYKAVKLEDRSRKRYDNRKRPLALDLSISRTDSTGE
jgi:hypothetical protein